MGTNNEEFNDEYDEATVSMTLEDGTELECDVIAIFPVNGQDYIALLPIEDFEKDDAEVFIYRYTEDAEGNPGIETITDEEEYEIAADAFDEQLDEEEFEELVSEEDL